MNVPGCAVADIGKILEVAYEIKNCINLKESLTSEQEAIISRHVAGLNLLLKVLKPLQTRDELPGSLNQPLLDLLPELKRYHDKCQAVHVRRVKFCCGIFRSVPNNSQLVGDLEKDFEGIANNLTLIINTGDVMLQFVQIPPIIINNVNPHTRKIALKPPHKVEEFAVEENGEFLDISWNDTKNKENLVLSYEMMYSDGEVEILLPQIKSQNKVSIGKPLVQPGKYYSFKIRAVNKDGHSEWSNEMRVLKKGVPERPSKPTIQVEGPNSVIVSVLQPTEDQSNGAPVTSCIVEYGPNDAYGNTTMCGSLTCSLKECSNADDKIKVMINKLNGDTLYDFRVKFQNEVGCSPPSESTTCQTHVPIPGLPEKLRVSTKRTSSMIKILWFPPSVNPEAVHRYELQMRTKKGKWQHITYSTKTSAKATRLKQNKKYFFRVQALNRKDQSCGFTDTIEEETRLGKAARAALAPLVFVGGTLSAPISSALVGGIGGGLLAAESVDNKAGAVAAGVATGVAAGVGGTIVGTLGAPVVGGMMTYGFIKMTGGDSCSDQSSDEEET